MKKMKCFLLTVFSLLTLSVFAQEKAENIKVYGECGMCKKRIEKAVSAVEGVQKAEWNVDTKQLRVTYDGSKTSLDTIQRKAASVGHDTEKYAADNAVYNRLPGCCHYERKVAGPAQGQEKTTNGHADHKH